MGELLSFTVTVRRLRTEDPRSQQVTPSSLGCPRGNKPSPGSGEEGQGAALGSIHSQAVSEEVPAPFQDGSAHTVFFLRFIPPSNSPQRPWEEAGRGRWG